MISGDGWGLYFPNICLTVEENSIKSFSQENWPDREYNPGPLGDRQRYYLSIIAEALCIPGLENRDHTKF